MATDVERLVVSLEANIKKYERELARSRGVTQDALRDVERTVSTSTSKIESAMARVGATIRGGIAGALAGISLGNLTSLSDSFTKIQNQLKVGGLEGDKLASTYQSLLDIAQKQGAPLESLATLYGRVSSAQKELNTNSGEMLRFTNAVALSLKVNGTSAAESSGALLQLAQALGGGKIQAEEFNSLIDGARPLLQAAAAGIKEAGGSVATLTALVKDGKVSSEAFFRGVLAGQGVLERLSATTKETSEQGLTRLRNALTDLVGKFVESTGASENAATSFTNLANGIEAIAKQVPGAVDALSKLAASFAATAQAYATSFGNLPVFANIAKNIADPKEVKRIEELMNGGGAKSSSAPEGIDVLRRAMQAQAAANAPKAKPEPTKSNMFDEYDAQTNKALAPKPISLKDYKVPGEKDDKGGGKSGADKVNDYERETLAIEKRTRAFDSERESVSKSAFEVAKAEASFRLMEAAKKANVPVTEELKAKVDALSTAYANAKIALDAAQEKQREFEAVSRQMGATLGDAFKDAVLEGEKLDQVLNKLLKSLASRGIDSIFDSLFSKTGAGTGFLKSIFGGGFASGGYTGPGRKNDPAGVVHAGELVWSQADIRRAGGLGRAEAMRRGSRGYAKGGIVGMPALAPMSPGRIAPARRSSARPSVRMGDVNINAPGADRQGLLQLKAYVDLSLKESRRTIGQQLSSWKEDN